MELNPVYMFNKHLLISFKISGLICQEKNEKLIDRSMQVSIIYTVTNGQLTAKTPQMNKHSAAEIVIAQPVWP